VLLKKSSLVWLMCLKKSLGDRGSDIRDKWYPHDYQLAIGVSQAQLSAFNKVYYLTTTKKKRARVTHSFH
jgi:hypothetical protein